MDAGRVDSPKELKDLLDPARSPLVHLEVDPPIVKYSQMQSVENLGFQFIGNAYDCNMNEYE